jgi:uncharacterized protein (DUF1778 family)
MKHSPMRVFWHWCFGARAELWRRKSSERSNLLCTAISRTINGIRYVREDQEMTDAVRDSRLDLRVAKSEKEAIERAAALSGSSTTDFVRSTMLVAAERAVRAHQVLELTSEGAAAFVDAITNPPEPNDNLRALAREAQEIPGQAKV